MKHQKCRREAFTLVELLVVIAIIGILVALLLPAIQAARESARRTQCNNNLKQLGVAVQNYHDVHERFPIGSRHQDPNSGGADLWAAGRHRKGSQLVKLLPFVEETAFYDQLDQFGDVEAQIDALRLDQEVPSYRCPSDDYDPGRAMTNYAPSIGAQAMPGRSCNQYPGNFLGRGPTGHGSTRSGENISGVFSRYDWSARMADVTDGTSNTICMGEIRPYCGDHHRGGWRNSNALWTATTAPINFPTCPGQNGGISGANGCNADGNWQTSQGFKSRHPGGAQFLFCDGSVHFLTEDIEYRSYQAMGCRNDGEPLGTGLN